MANQACKVTERTLLSSGCQPGHSHCLSNISLLLSAFNGFSMIREYIYKSLASIPSISLI